MEQAEDDESAAAVESGDDVSDELSELAGAHGCIQQLTWPLLVVALLVAAFWFGVGVLIAWLVSLL